MELAVSTPALEESVRIATKTLEYIRSVAVGETTKGKVVVAKVGAEALLAVGPSHIPHADIINEASTEILQMPVAVQIADRQWRAEPNVMIQGGLLQYLPGDPLILYGESSFGTYGHSIFVAPTKEAATRILSRMILSFTNNSDSQLNSGSPVDLSGETFGQR